MSKTDKTNPFWVKLRHRDLRAVERHNHSTGPCDLPAEIGGDWWDAGRRCQYEYRYTGIGDCGCWMCRSRDWPRTETQRRRRERRQRRCSFEPNPLGVPTVEIDQRVTSQEYRAILQAFAAPIGMDILDVDWNDPPEGREP